MTTRLDAFVPPAPSPARSAVLARLADELLRVRPGERATVAIDGVDGAGKTVLARELQALLGERREVHRASIDGFHRPRAQRYAAGRTPLTYCRDSYDHDAIRERLVGPFLAGAPFVCAVHDVEADEPLDVAPLVAGPGALLLVDGVFLYRPALAPLWDASVWVEVPFQVSVPRGNARFGPVDAAAADPSAASNQRYVAGQQLYLADASPRSQATWVLDNTDLDHPVLREHSPGTTLVSVLEAGNARVRS